MTKNRIDPPSGFPLPTRIKVSIPTHPLLTFIEVEKRLGFAAGHLFLRKIDADGFNGWWHPFGKGIVMSHSKDFWGRVKGTMIAGGLIWPHLFGVDSQFLEAPRDSVTALRYKKHFW